MPPQNQPTPVQPTPENQRSVQNPENSPVQSPESKPETTPAPATPERPTETFQDQSSLNTVPAQSPTGVQEPPEAQVPPQTVTEEDEAQDPGKMDKVWVKTVDTVIEKDKDKPYEEEEDSEKLQVDYLSKRFGKQVPKDENK